SGLLFNWVETGSLFNKKIFDLFTISCMTFFFLQFAGLLYTHNQHDQWNDIRIKTSLLFIPLAVNCCNYPDSRTRQKLLTGYCLILFSACIYCLVAVLIKYLSLHDETLFFYYELVRPLSQHAILFAILVLIALFFLFESFNKNQIVFS